MDIKNLSGTTRRAATLVLLIMALGLISNDTRAAGVEDDIRHLMMATFDKPEARLQVNPVVYDGDHAVAGWIQGQTGGRALLRKREGRWVIWLCSGDGIKSADALAGTGIARDAAVRLSQALADAEARLPAQTLALFSTFDGTVMIEGGEHPAPAHGAAQHHH